MTVDDIIAELDDSGFSDYSTARKLLFVNRAYHDICTREPWPFLEKEQTGINIASGDKELTLPSDWSKTLKLRFFEDGSTEQGWTLWKERLDWIRETYPVDQSGRPVFYYFRNNKLFFFPKADRAYDAIHEYVQKTTDLASGGAESTILIPPRHHEILLLGALYRCYLQDQDPAMLNEIRNLYTQKYLEMRADLWLRDFEADRIYDIDPFGSES